MTVITGGTTIFCEGKQSSLDYKLLNKIVGEISGERCTIVPAGSKFTFSIFAEGYFFPNAVKNQKYLIFRDRDFDAYPESTVQLLQPTGIRNQRIALTHRSCVENYLLDPNLIDHYWIAKYQEKCQNPTSKWGHGDSPGIETISIWIENCARSLQFYQAVRWALGDLLSTSRKQLKTTWTGGSGKLPESLDLQSCRNQALELIDEFKKGVEFVTAAKFSERLDFYQEFFSQENFWEQKQYIIWFQGKDLQKEMQRQQPNYISLSSFFDESIAQLNITLHPDLMELKMKIEEL